MDKMRVSKMGDKFVVLITSADYSHKDKVVLKPKGLDIKLYDTVSKSGNKLLVIIPKNYWEFFKHKAEVYVKKW